MTPPVRRVPLVELDELTDQLPDRVRRLQGQVDFLVVAALPGETDRRLRCPWCLEDVTAAHRCEYEHEAATALDELHQAPEIHRPFHSGDTR